MDKVLNISLYSGCSMILPILRSSLDDMLSTEQQAGEETGKFKTELLASIGEGRMDKKQLGRLIFKLLKLLTWPRMLWLLGEKDGYPLIPTSAS